MGARTWRAYHPGLPAEAGAEVELSPEETHHVARVLRLESGERLRLFDGAGNEWEAVLVESSSRKVLARLETAWVAPVEPGVELVLFQGLCRNDRMEYAIQKATEVGVAAIHPLRSRRSEGRPPQPRQIARWRRIAVEAAKQSGRRRVPSIEPHDELPAPPGRGVTAAVLDAASGAGPLRRLLEAPPAGQFWLAVGPESGFSGDELERFESLGWARAGLGPRTLRAETAGVVAASIVLHSWGDLGR